MKKTLVTLLAFVLVAVTLVVAVSADNFVPSADIRELGIIRVEIDGVEIEEHGIVLTPIKYIDTLEGTERDNFEAAIKDFQDAANITDLFDASAKATVENTVVGTMANLNMNDFVVPEGKTIEITVSADFGASELEVAMKKYPEAATQAEGDAAEWVIIDSAYESESGELTFKIGDDVSVAALSVLVKGSPIVSDPSSDSPETGDSSAPTAALIVIAVAAGAAACVFGTRKNRNA